MKTFRQFNELFDKKSIADWELSYDGRYRTEYNFVLNGDEEVKVGFHLSPTSDKKNNPKEKEDPISYEIGFVRGDSSDITGEGNALEIFATVYAILKDFMKRKKPTHVFFSAKEASRKKLYKVLSRKLAKELKMNFEEEDIKDLSYFNLWKK
jgi:hypothetical protein